MAFRFSAEMKIESKNYNIPIFIYSRIEKKKFNTNINLIPKTRLLLRNTYDLILNELLTIILSINCHFT